MNQPTRTEMITIEDVKKNKTVHKLVEKADQVLGVIGYTEHGFRHCSLAANIAYNIMIRLGKGEKRAQLAAIAGYMHDIGNVINRDYHANRFGYGLLCIAGDGHGDVGYSRCHRRHRQPR